jgi:hypothetical protein
LTAIMETVKPGDPEVWRAAWDAVIAEHQIADRETVAGQEQIHCACGARTGWQTQVDAVLNHSNHISLVTWLQPAESCGNYKEHAIHGLCPGNLAPVVRTEPARTVVPV